MSNPVSKIELAERKRRKRLSAQAWFQRILEALEEGLRLPRPGLKAQLMMIPHPRPGHKVYQEVEDSCLKAGVSILLYPWRGRAHLVLTRRTGRMRHHQAQVSFPGGRQEPGESPVQAALREACEELGIPPQSLRTVGELTPLYVPPSNYCIYPVVAVAEKRPDFLPSSEEVDEVIEIPLDHLLDPLCVRKEVWSIRGMEILIPYYSFREHKIWGATAMILAELLQVVKSVENRSY